MPPVIIESIAPLIALFGLGIFGLAGLKTWLAYKAKRVELESGAHPTELGAAMDELRNEVQLLRGDIAELHERVDFAERLLTRGSSGEARD